MINSDENAIDEILNLNKVIHEPARLAILTILSIAETCDFLFLINTTKLTKGNLSSHLSKLETAEFVKIEKKFIGKTPKTFISITQKGKESINDYWKSINKLSKENK